MAKKQEEFLISSFTVGRSEPVQLEDVDCPLGCSRSDEIILTGRDRLHHLPGEFTVVKCRTCELMRTNPRPTAASIGAYYPEDYGPYVGTRIKQPKLNRFSGLKSFFRPLVRWVFNTQSDVLPPIPVGRLLEIGCASGSYLDRMARCGWEVEGVEYSEEAAQAARDLGYSVRSGALESAEEPDCAPDLIVGWMVLEHLHDPIECLKKLHQWTNPGAWMVITVPDVNALAFKMYRENWYDLHLPNHLYHFTRESLSKVLETAGWTLAEVRHQRSIVNLLASTAYAMESKGWTSLANWLLEFSGRGGKWFYIMFPFAWALGVCGQSGRMTVWCRRGQEKLSSEYLQSSAVAAKKA